MPTKGGKKKAATVNLTGADMQILLKRLGYSNQKDFLDDLAMDSLIQEKEPEVPNVEVVEAEIGVSSDNSKRLSWAEEVEAVETIGVTRVPEVQENLVGKPANDDVVVSAPSIATEVAESLNPAKEAEKVNLEIPKSVKSWSEVVQGNRSLGSGFCLEYIPPANVVKISAEDWENGAKLWRYPVVCAVRNVKPSYADMIRWVEVNWKGLNPRVTQLQPGVFIFDFAEEEQRLGVVQKNWTYYHKYSMMMKFWSPDMKEDFLAMDTTNVWVQLPGLYPRLWSPRNLSNVVSFIGKPITTDKMTAQRTRMDFARVLVEVKVGEKLPDAVPIEGPNDTTIMQPVVYELRAKKCLKCGRLGHEEDQCRQRNVRSTEVMQPVEKAQTVEPMQKEQTIEVEVPVDTVECWEG